MNPIVRAPHYDKAFVDWLANPEVVTWARNWDETLELPKRTHSSGSRVAVVPSATMAYYDG